MFELRLYRRGEEVRGPSHAPMVIHLRLEREDETHDLLNRHLIGAAKRAGARDSDLHNFELVVREVDSVMRPKGVQFRWALPVGEVS